MLLLLDVGNTNTHLGLASSKRLVRQMDVPTQGWSNGAIKDAVLDFTNRDAVDGVSFCSVVPRVTPLALKLAWQLWKLDALELTPKTLRGLGIDYPNPKSIGPDRLANAAGRPQSFRRACRGGGFRHRGHLRHR